MTSAIYLQAVVFEKSVVYCKYFREIFSFPYFIDMFFVVHFTPRLRYRNYLKCVVTW